MNALKAILMIVTQIGFFVISLFQMGALYAFFSEYWGWWFIFAAPAALIAGGIPVIGGIAGTLAAHEVWGWNLMNAAMLFFWPIGLFVLLVLFGGADEILKKFRKK